MFAWSVYGKVFGMYFAENLRQILSRTDLALG